MFAASALVGSFVTVCDFSALVTCYAELNDRLRPEADISLSTLSQLSYAHCGGSEYHRRSYGRDG